MKGSGHVQLKPGESRCSSWAPPPRPPVPSLLEPPAACLSQAKTSTQVQAQGPSWGAEARGLCGSSRPLCPSPTLYCPLSAWPCLPALWVPFGRRGAQPEMCSLGPLRMEVVPEYPKVSTGQLCPQAPGCPPLLPEPPRPRPRLHPGHGRKGARASPAPTTASWALQAPTTGRSPRRPGPTCTACTAVAPRSPSGRAWRSRRTPRACTGSRRSRPRPGPCDPCWARPRPPRPSASLQRRSLNTSREASQAPRLAPARPAEGVPAPGRGARGAQGREAALQVPSETGTGSSPLRLVPRTRACGARSGLGPGRPTGHCGHRVPRAALWTAQAPGLSPELSAGQEAAPGPAPDTRGHSWSRGTARLTRHPRSPRGSRVPGCSLVSLRPRTPLRRDSSGGGRGGCWPPSGCDLSPGSRRHRNTSRRCHLLLLELKSSPHSTRARAWPRGSWRVGPGG